MNKASGSHAPPEPGFIPICTHSRVVWGRSWFSSDGGHWGHAYDESVQALGEGLEGEVGRDVRPPRRAWKPGPRCEPDGMLHNILHAKQPRTSTHGPGAVGVRRQSVHGLGEGGGSAGAQVPSFTCAHHRK